MTSPYTLSFFTFIFLAASLSHASETKTETANCWDASLYDLDGDGYADDSAWSSHREEVASTYADKASCPEGYVASRGDCDDTNPDVHPRQNEVFGNDIDDNCNELVDEPNFYYYPSGFFNNTSSFKMAFAINDREVRDVQENIFQTLKVEVEYQRLSDTSKTLRSGKKSLDRYFSFGSFVYGETTLSRLKKTTVYRARVQFYKTSAFRVVPIYGPVIDREPAYKPVGAPSAWYYTTTEGTSSISKARTKILLQGFYQYYEGNHRGLVGYRGAEDPDGTRYEAVRGEAWCSEFYSWVASHALDGMGHKNSVARLVSYFNTHDAGLSNPSLYQIKNKIKRGDYLGEDTYVDEESIKNHSAMFLDYDRHTKMIWTLDGNSHGYNRDPSVHTRNRKAGNEVTLRLRDPEVVLYWGKISKSPLK